jgi:hypothetical protein
MSENLKNLKVASSPERHTFRQEGYIKRCEEEGKDPNPDYINLYKTWREQDEANLVDPAWQKDNLEYDLRSTKWICDKAKASESYAQNLYAAMCNMQFTKLDVMTILKDQRWSASWRHAGGIVADMREEGNYIDWYCSGIGDEELGYGLDHRQANGYVPEGQVTEEIKLDLNRLGWILVKWGDDVEDSTK